MNRWLGQWSASRSNKSGLKHVHATGVSELPAQVSTSRGSALIGTVLMQAD